MKYSQYNIILPDEGGEKIFYNTYSDRIISITTDVYNLLMKYKENIDEIKDLHPSFYEAIQANGFIVEDEKNEYTTCLNDFYTQNENPSYVHLTINPTMDCNFRCWYCYEKHNTNSKMSKITLESINNLISDLLSRENVTRLVLSFFGGEPLMYFKDIMCPIISFTEKCCKDMGKQFDILITTNGYLLLPSVVQHLSNYVSVGLQIPIDGDRGLHNRTKFLKNKSGTYDQVIENTKNAIKHGLRVTVRCNYTIENINSFFNVLDEFMDIKDHQNVEFAFHKIWQEDQTKELQETYEKVFDKFILKGLMCRTNVSNKGVCYADYKQNLVVNYNGDVYKCTARDFNEQNKLGDLNPDGTILWSEKAQLRLQCKYHSKACEQCQIFPICMQSCSQNVFEASNTEGCLFGDYADSIAKQMVESRIKILVR